MTKHNLYVPRRRVVDLLTHLCVFSPTTGVSHSKFWCVCLIPVCCRAPVLLQNDVEQPHSSSVSMLVHYHPAINPHWITKGLLICH